MGGIWVGVRLWIFRFFSFSVRVSVGGVTRILDEEGAWVRLWEVVILIRVV